MTDMHLRRFQPGDEPALYRIYFSAIHEIASQDYSPEQVNAWAPAERDAELWASGIRALNPFVVELDDELVGYADIQRSGYIDHFFVSGRQPRRGIGRLLMERIHEEAELLGLSELTANVSKTAEPFFVAFGFEVVERRNPVRMGVVLHNALMRKRLRA